jgi:DNA-binding MarR family transcriptional regulator
MFPSERGATLAERDSIDELLEHALQVFPDLHPQTEAAVDRIHKIEKSLKRRYDELSARFGLNRGESEVLVKLRQAEDGLSPGYLADRLMLSTGAMTNRLDHLEEAGLIRRDADPDDRRASIVRLTDRGVDMIGSVISEIGKMEYESLSVLSETELKKLNDLLRKVLLRFESD